MHLVVNFIPSFRLCTLAAFLQPVQFSILCPTSQAHPLEASITTNDIDKAIAHLKMAKAPGSNCLPLELYTQFRDTLQFLG